MRRLRGEGPAPLRPARERAFHVAVTLTGLVPRDAYVAALRRRLGQPEADPPDEVPAPTRNAARLWRDLAAGTTTFRLAAAGPDAVRSYTGIETALPGFGGEGLADVTHGGAWYIGALVTPGVPELLLAGREQAFVETLLPSGAPAEAIARAYARPGGFRAPRASTARCCPTGRSCRRSSRRARSRCRCWRSARRPAPSCTGR